MRTTARLRDVWFALRACVRAVLEQVTLADVAKGELPSHIVELTQDADAGSAVRTATPARRRRRPGAGSPTSDG